MVVIGGVEAALREGRWDKKAWRDAEDTREAAVGWLLAAAGGNLAANGNELATKLVEDGFDTWAAMDLSEQELAGLGFNRGGARSFATECRAMREARGIFERPQSLAMQELEEEGPVTPLVQAMAVAKAQGRKRVTVPAFPSTDTAGVKGCGVGPMPEKQLAVAWVLGNVGRGPHCQHEEHHCHRATAGETGVSDQKCEKRANKVGDGAGEGKGGGRG